MKKPKDAMSTAAIEIVAMENRHDEISETMKGAKEKAIYNLAEMAGRIRATNFFKTQADFFQLLLLKQVKDAKEYREKLDMTWESFCNSLGLKRRTVDEQLEDLKPFKLEFLAAFRQFSSVDFHQIKYLGEAVNRRIAEIKDNKIVFNGQEIAIVPENKNEIQAVLEKIEATYKQDLDNAQAEARAQKKLVKSKEDVIVKQEKDLRKFEKRAEGRGLSPEEDAFNDQIDELRTQFTGYLSRILPDKIEELNGDQNTVTAQMRASYITLLEWMFMQIKAARDTAEERFGADLKESEWKQQR